MVNSEIVAYLSQKLREKTISKTQKNKKQERKREKKEKRKTPKKQVPEWRKESVLAYQSQKPSKTSKWTT